VCPISSAVNLRAENTENGEIMKVLACSCLVLAAMCIPLYARHTINVVNPLQATVVRVDKSKPAAEFTGGDNPSDAPLQPVAYEYDITLRVGCGTYVGRYESAYAYLPSAIATDGQVKVKLRKHFVDVEADGQEIHMRILHCKVSRDSGCDERPQQSAAKTE
jgi:hypothetical protein